MRTQRFATLAAVAFFAACVAVTVTSSSTSKPFPRAAPPSPAARVAIPRAAGTDAVDLTNPPFHMAVSHRWRTFDLTKQRLDDMNRALQKTNPKLAAYFGTTLRSLIANHARFFAFDPATGSNVSIVAVPGNVDDETTVQLQREMRSVPGVESVVVSKFEIDGHSALRGSYVLGLNGANGEREVARGLQIYVESARSVVVVTVTTLNGAGSSAAASIARSIRVPTAD